MAERTTPGQTGKLPTLITPATIESQRKDAQRVGIDRWITDKIQERGTGRFVCRCTAAGSVIFCVAVG